MNTPANRVPCPRCRRHCPVRGAAVYGNGANKPGTGACSLCGPDGLLPEDQRVVPAAMAVEYALSSPGANYNEISALRRRYKLR